MLNTFDHSAHIRLSCRPNAGPFDTPKPCGELYAELGDVSVRFPVDHITPQLLPLSNQSMRGTTLRCTVVATSSIIRLYPSLYW
jgi:hypothetical protein